jgi:sulfate permease, SulP family
VSIYEISGPFFFGTAKEYCNVIQEVGVKSDVLIIRMRHVPFIDTTGLVNLKELIKTLQHSKTHVILSGVNENVKNELQAHGIVDLVGSQRVYDNFAEALEIGQKLANEM